MTYSHDTKACAKCGAEFKRSRADRTVNCPDCRKAARERSYAGVSRADEFYVKAGEARARGRAAQAAGDQAAYDQAVSDFRYWNERRQAEIARVG